MPRLARWYGTPGEPWLTMPLWLLRCYVQMLPRLQAEEALLHVQAGLGGNPWTDEAVRTQIVEAWQGIVQPAPVAQPEPMTPETFAAQMQMLGMRMEGKRENH